MAGKPTRTLSDQFILRLPMGMRDRIKRAADQSGRSMNAEIVSVLEREYPDDSGAMTLDQLNELISWVSEGQGLEEFDRRLKEANSRLAGKGYAIRLDFGASGSTTQGPGEVVMFRATR